MATSKKATIGDNSRSDDVHRKVLYFHSIREREEQNVIIEEARTKRTLAAKVAAARGFTVDQLDYGLKAYKAADQAAPLTKLRSHIEINEWLGTLAGGQMDMLRDVLPQNERLYNAGHVAALLGKEKVSGYAPGSQEDMHWYDGYAAGKKLYDDNILDALAKTEEPTQTKPRKTTLIKAGDTLTMPTPAEGVTVARATKPPPEPAARPSRSTARKEAEALFNKH